MFDTVITGGRVIDGTGAIPYQATIAIRDGRIVEIGAVSGDTEHDDSPPSP